MKLVQLMHLFDTIILVPADVPIGPETCTVSVFYNITVHLIQFLWVYRAFYVNVI
jgi:hypothetical protein